VVLKLCDCMTLARLAGKAELAADSVDQGILRHEAG
jgi:hypothetical protein